MCVCVCARARARVCACVRACVGACVRAHAHVCTYTCMCAGASFFRPLFFVFCFVTLGRALQSTETARKGKPFSSSPVTMRAGCGGKPADVYFVLDTALDTEPEAVQEQKRFLTDLSALFYLRKGATRVGIVSYGHAPITATPLGASVTLPEVQSAVQDAPRVGGSRHTSQVGQRVAVTGCPDHEYSGSFVRADRIKLDVAILGEGTSLVVRYQILFRAALSDSSPHPPHTCALCD